MSMFTYKSQQLLKHIQDLQCHKCQDVPAPNDDKKNRYSCINESHVLCENHKAECPCGSLVGKKPVFPKIFEDLPWMCQNYKHGCREIKSDVEELEYHQRKCIFRQVHCPHFFCKPKVLFKDVIDHVNTFHENTYSRVPKNVGRGKMSLNAPFGLVKFDFINKTKYAWMPAKIHINDYVFYDVGYFKNNTFHFWTYFIGSQDEAQKFSCAYSVKNTIGETFLYGGPVHTLDEEKDDIISSGSCFAIPKNAVKRSLIEEGRIEPSITIRNLKEEAKDDDMESGISDND